jgi:cardiolipin synthase
MAFNPAHKFILRLYINYRNHQRIVVIDGNIGYTGGANINDECVNLRSKYGYWKDTAIRLKGDAVWSMTVIFLQMWQLESKKSENYFKYQPTIKLEGDGFYQPFSDGPFNNPRNPAETMYHQMISNAKEYIYITTPYLIIDASMIERLCIAAKSGVDVRIVVPKIFDKWNAQKVSRSNYEELMDAGVRIYEYSPGYIHAKTIISDDDHAITGSINMNYRSFYLHFENGIWICDAPVISDIKNDIEQTFEVSEEIFINEWKNRSRIEKAMESLLCVLSPLF